MKHHLKMVIAALLILFMGGSAAFAQSITKGKVVDASGEPVIGASVLVPGTTTGTVTDMDGNFELRVEPGTRLEVSSIGYSSVIVTAAPTLNITLQEDTTFLDDVVVIGYQTVKRRDLTGAVSSVTGNDIAAVPVASAAQALQGKLPGVTVTSGDGRPGGSTSIRVRGGNSITQSNDPLFIVDGVTVSNIDDIPADNIESIDVLKDAASTAIYGARGANGVVLVTTKGGKEGKAVVRYGMYYQLSENPRMLDVLDAQDAVYWAWAYSTAYSGSEAVAEYYGLGSKFGNHYADYANVKAHNYMNDVLRPSNSWNHDISLSGGTSTTTYYASVNYIDNQGIRINSGFKRWNANLKLSQKIGKSLTADIDVRYGQTGSHGMRVNNSSEVYKFRPIDNPLGTGDPNLFNEGASGADLAYNPLNSINNKENITSRQNLRATGGLTWRIIDGLIAKSELSLSRNYSETKNWDSGDYVGDAYSMADLSLGRGTGLRWSNTVNYTVPIKNDNHSLNILAGYEVLSSESTTSRMRGAGFPQGFTMDDAFGMINMSDSSLGQDLFTNTLGIPSHTVSYFGRLNYGLMGGRYLFTATFRADGSSKFAPNHRWGYFPAAAAAWHISDEPFMENTKTWMDDLKLRLSYGTSGADNIDASLWQETWNTSNITIDGEVVTGYVPGSLLSNPDLKWETSVSRNVGLDFSFLKSRIRGSLDAYWNTTKDILMRIPVDATTGYSYQYGNVGQTSNKGVELAVNAVLVQKRDWGLSLGFTYAFNKNNVDALADGATVDTHTGWGSTMRVPYMDYLVRVGQPVGIVQGFDVIGYYTVDDFDIVDGKYKLKDGIPGLDKSIFNYAQGMDALKYDTDEGAFPGALKIADTNKDGTITGDDATIIAQMMPKHTGGFNLSGNWKNLDFSANFSYQLDGKVYNANAMHSMMGNKTNSYGQNKLAYVNDSWRAYNVNASGDLYLVTDPAELRTLNANAKYAVPFAEYGIVTSTFIENAAYLRLNTLTIGYTLPQKWMEAIHINRIRAYATIGNLFVLSSYSGLDPDVNTSPSTNGFPTPYYDSNAYPKSRTFTFGFNVTF